MKLNPVLFLCQQLWHLIEIKAYSRLPKSTQCGKKSPQNVNLVYQTMFRKISGHRER